MYPTESRSGQKSGPQDLPPSEMLALRAELEATKDSLRQSEENFRLFVAASSDAIYKMSGDWSEMRNLKGLNFIADTDTPSQIWLDRYIPFEAQPQVMAAIEKAISTKSTFELEHAVIRTDGTTGWTFSRAIPVFDGNNEIVEWFGVATDITERKRGEDAVRSSEAHLTTVFAQAKVGISEISAEGRFLRVNAELCRLLGRTSEQLLEMNVSDVTHPEDMVGSMEIWKQVLQTGKSQSCDKRHLCPDGSVIWANSSVSLLRHADGRVSHLLAVTVDLTGRRKDEETVRESEERLRLVMESVTEYAIMTLDTNGVITSWNSGAEKAFGWTAQEAIGQPNIILFTPEDRETGQPYEEMCQAQADGRAADERWHMRKGGERFWVSGILSLLRNGETVTGYVKIARDLTEQRQVAEALLESEARFRTLSNEIPQIIWTNEGRGKATYFNARWFEYSGLTLEESTGPGWQAIVHPEDAPASVEQWNQVLQRGEALDTEYRLRRFDGVYRWHIGRNVPLCGSDGGVVSWFGTATDIQDLKEAQEALSQAHDDLEVRVLERTRELEQALEQVKAEVEQRRQLEVARAELVKRIVNTQEAERGRVSRELHDNLGQHLTAVMWGLEALEKQIKDMSGGQRKEETPQLETLRTLVDGLMKAAHRQAWELRPAELDAMGLEAALGQYIRDWSERTGIEVDLQALGWENRPASEVETTLYRVVQEALTNVARHAGASWVSVVLERRHDMVSAIIEDNGRGFDIEPGTRRLGILGMRERLAIVGGSLDIESIPGDGTSVFARVPLLHLEPSSSGE